MERWQNKAAVVTGASSGIGAALCVDLVKAGMVVAALARREDRLVSLRDSLPENLRSRLHPIRCDVTLEADVIRAFRWVEEHLGGVYVLINNAGVVKEGNLIDQNNTDLIRAAVDTNVMGVVYATREAFHSMKEKDVAGHIININSIVGHYVPPIPGFPMSIYPATKHAITAMTETYRQEFSNLNTNIKVTSISPGAVETEIFRDEMKAKIPTIKAADVSSAILYCIQLHQMYKFMNSRSARSTKSGRKVICYHYNYQIQCFFYIIWICLF
uniref:Dehydrogenase n=1 Tax=Megaselia scalaris TaxID=36166 RepID=T1GFR0_MEGSC